MALEAIKTAMSGAISSTCALIAMKSATSCQPGVCTSTRCRLGSCAVAAILTSCFGRGLKCRCLDAIGENMRRVPRRLRKIATCFITAAEALAGKCRQFTSPFAEYASIERKQSIDKLVGIDRNQLRRNFERLQRTFGANERLAV